MKPNTSRAKPRIWKTDWLVLRELSSILGHQVERRLPHGSQVVDLGCGAMPYRSMMLQAGISYVGADIDGTGDLRIGLDGRVPLGDGSCDAIMSIQVLEHVDDLDAYCAEICRLLRPEGTLLLSTHGTWLYHPHPRDLRRWTRTGLSTELARRGLAVEETISIVGPLATTTIIRLTGFAFMLRKLPIVGVSLAGALAVLMNLRAMLEDKVTPQSIRHDNACIYFVTARKAAS
jgi:SAM-dependent methyltransferase